MPAYELRRLIKRTLAYVLYYSGALWLYAVLRLRGRAVVLTYHRVLPDSADSFSASGIVVSPDTFAAHMGFLRRYFHPLSASEFQACLQNRKFPRRACLVTFDDGWFDNERYALPILQRHDVHAVLFIATGYIGTRTVFWQEELTRLLFAASRQRGSAPQLLSDLGIEHAVATDDLEARRIVRDLVTRLKAETSESIERIRGRLIDALGGHVNAATAFGDDVFLEWDAVTRLASSGLVTIGSHAHTHVPLTRLGREGARVELATSRQIIEQLGLPAPLMCAYPNGDYGPEVLAAINDAGYSVGFTTEKGYVECGDDPRQLPRINMNEAATSSAPGVLCRILGLF